MVLTFAIVTVASSIFFDVLASSTEFITTFFSAYFDNNIYEKSELATLQAETTGANLRQMLTLGFTRVVYIYLYYHFRKKHLLSDPLLNNITLIGMIAIVVILLLGYNMIFSRLGAYIRIFYNLGWGVLTYTTFIRGRDILKDGSKLLVCMVLFYLFGSFISGIGAGRRSEINDVNPYLVYQIYKN